MSYLSPPIPMHLECKIFISDLFWHSSHSQTIAGITFHVQLYNGLTRLAILLMRTQTCGWFNPASSQTIDPIFLCCPHWFYLSHSTFDTYIQHGTTFIFHHIKPHHCYNAFQAFYVNKYVDHHAFWACKLDPSSTLSLQSIDWDVCMRDPSPSPTI